MPISLNPKTFSMGGLLNDADVEIVSSRFTVYDYNGTITDPQQMSVALRLDMRVLDSGEEHVEYFSFGRVPDWSISEDGKTVDPITGKRPNANSVFSMFMQSLIEAGFDESKLDAGDISVLEGLKLHVIRKAAPESWKSLPGMKRKEEGREKTYLAVERILEQPQPKKAAGAAKAQPKADVPAEVLQKLEQVAMEELPADGSPLKVKALQIAIMKRKDFSPEERRALNEAIQKGALQQIEMLEVKGDEVSILSV